jgi:hypothetical protein
MRSERFKIEKKERERQKGEMMSCRRRSFMNPSRVCSFTGVKSKISNIKQRNCVRYNFFLSSRARYFLSVPHSFARDPAIIASSRTTAKKSMRATILLVFLSTFCISSSFSQQRALVTLTDKTFEHETQASTGQTSGKWVIYFDTSHSSNHFLTPTLKASLMKLDKLQHQEQRGEEEYAGEPFIAATINVDEEYFTRARFANAGLTFPCLVVFERRKMRLFEARHPEGEEHKALGKGVKDVQEWLEMSNEESEGGGEVRYLSVPEPLSMAQATSVRAQMAMRVFKEGKLRAKRDWQHAMKAKGEAGMGAMFHEMEESFKKSPKLYGSILIGIALTMIASLIAMSSVLFAERRGASKRKEE